MIGRRFGKLVALSIAPSDRHRFRMMNCRCDCGRAHTTRASSLRLGYAQSCGCDRDAKFAQNSAPRHGHAVDGKTSRAWNAWSAMHKRCECATHKAYKNYGGRGIGICRRWKTFENFYADMGDPPPGLTLERRANNRGYEPSNCLWASYDDQNRNRRSTKLTLRSVSRIRRALAAGAKQRDLANQHGVCHSTISAIARRRIWKDVGYA